MSVTLRKRKNKNGSTSLLLDIYHNGVRDIEFLKHLKLSKAVTPADREHNKENLELAKKIAAKRSHELSANDYDMSTSSGKNTLVTVWMKAYVANYKKKDKRNMEGVTNRFIDFLTDQQIKALTFGKLTETLIMEFQDYLRSRSVGEGASSYFNRFKKMLKQVKREKIVITNPAEDVKTKSGAAKKKDVLTIEEIQLLAKTPCNSTEVKRAALFSCVTGYAWTDVKNLKWSMVNLQSGYMVKGREKNNGEVDELYINLNSTAVQLLGKAGNPDDYVFELPTANGCNKTVKAWVKRAGIEKKITWHNFRHSFGTNLVLLGTDVISASALLGHTSLKHTQRYVRAANEAKQRATDKLNIQL